MPSKELTAALKLAEERNLRFVSLQFTDIVGQVKSVQVPMHQLEEAVEHGKWFDGSSIEGFARIAESDMFLVPDLATFSPIPWEPGFDPDGSERATGAARVICDVFTPNGEPFPGDPRWVLRRQVEKAKKLGFVLNTGPELEFFLLRRSETDVETLPHDAAGYFDLSEDLGTEVRKEMMNDLEAFGIKVETAHHEVATGQHEIDFEYADALRTADNAVTFKTTLKAVAARQGLYATFMPKPFFGINGSGMHTHQSLWDIKKERNAFADAKDDYGLSDTARSYIAGTLEHARGMIAVLAPLVNSYKRLVPGYEAPVYIGWARINRSALIRIPQISHGQLNSTRIELRCPDPSTNPYLAFACMLRLRPGRHRAWADPAGPGGGEPVPLRRRQAGQPPDQAAAGHAARGAGRAGRRPRHRRGAGRARLRALRGGQDRGVGRVPDAGDRLGGGALPGGLLAGPARPQRHVPGLAGSPSESVPRRPASLAESMMRHASASPSQPLTWVCRPSSAL